MFLLFFSGFGRGLKTQDCPTDRSTGEQTQQMFRHRPRVIFHKMSQLDLLLKIACKKRLASLQAQFVKPLSQFREAHRLYGNDPDWSDLVV